MSIFKRNDDRSIMISRRITFPALAVLVLASLALGVLAALADGRDAAKPTPRALVVARPGHAPLTVTRLTAAARSARVLRALRPVAFACPAAPSPASTPKAEPVPQSILDAFGVLRRDATDADALPKAALDALRARGLEPFDPAAARLLRTTAAGGHAWVVPVRDVGDQRLAVLRCALPAAAVPAPVPVLPRAARRAARKALRAVPAPGVRAPLPARPRAATTPVPPATEPAPAVTTPPAATAPATPTAPQRPLTATAPAPAAPTPAKATPHPGLAVVALDGAPAGAGGRLEDLVRGREPVAIDPCGGPNRDMLSVSGIVPDGVAAAFLTSPDGTAVRADVTDNAYAFVVPRAKTPEERYVVWTGGDGTPHVQPLGAPVFVARARCASAGHAPPTVSPDGSGLCGHFTRAAVPAIPMTPSPLLYRAPCAIATPLAVTPPKRHG